MKETKYLYRYVSDYPEDDNDTCGIRLHRFEIKKESEDSYWITVPYYLSRDRKTHENKAVRKNAQNTFAYDTREKALENYKARTRIYRSLLRSMLDHVERCYALVDKVDTNDVRIGYVVHEPYPEDVEITPIPDKKLPPELQKKLDELKDEALRVAGVPNINNK